MLRRGHGNPSRGIGVSSRWGWGPTASEEDVMRTQWTGAGTALVTPFTRSGDVDEAGIRRLVRRQVDGGIHFLSPCGTTGENPTLTDAERRRVVELVVGEAAG